MNKWWMQTLIDIACEFYKWLYQKVKKELDAYPCILI